VGGLTACTYPVIMRRILREFNLGRLPAIGVGIFGLLCLISAVTVLLEEYEAASSCASALVARPLVVGSCCYVCADVHNCIGRALSGELPPRYRDALILTEWQGMSQDELAKKVGLSVSGAKSRVQRARSQLKQLLLDCCRFEIDRRGNVIDYTSRAKSECRDCK
jgi:hypothetical protein